MTGHGKVKALEEKEPRIFDDETIYDYLIQRSNELEFETMVIQLVLEKLGIKSGNQSNDPQNEDVKVPSERSRSSSNQSLTQEEKDDDSMTLPEIP